MGKKTRRQQGQSESGSSTSEGGSESQGVDRSATVGNELEIGGALLDKSTNENSVAGAGIKLGEVGANGGLNQNGVYGEASASVGEVSARLSHGRAVNLDPAALILDTLRTISQAAI